MFSRRVVLSFLSIFVGYSIFCLYGLSLRFGFGFPTEVYWLSFVFVSIPLLFEAVFWKSSPKLRLFYLLSFSLMISLQYAVVDSSAFLSSEDAVADYRLTDRIISDGQWTPLESVEWGFGSEYRFHPVTNFIYATLSLLTEIPLILVVKYLFVIRAFVITPIAQRLFKNFFSQKVAYLATIIFLASPGAILFPHKEAFAVIFFIIGLYVVTKTEKTRQYLLLGIVSIFTLIMTHHFTTYIFLILLTALFLANKFYGTKKTVRISSQFYILSLVVFVTWVTVIAWSIVAQHQRVLFSILFQNLFSGSLTFAELLPLYAPYESIIVWLGYGITLLSAGFGLLVFIRNKKSLSSSFFALILVLLPILVLATLIRFLPVGFSIGMAHRAYEFGYLIVGALSSLFVIGAIKLSNKSSLKIVLIGAVLVMILLGPMASATHPRTFARVSNIISEKSMSTSVWMNSSGAATEYTIGDRFVRIIVSGYGDSLTLEYPEIYSSPDFSIPLDLGHKISYVITHKYVTDFYGPNADKFYTSPYLNNLYSNGMLTVFSVTNQSLFLGP